MSVALGIGIGAERIRAVLLRNGRIVAARETEVSVGEPLAGAVAELLRGLPLPRFPRPRATIAVGPASSQTRRIGGLPLVDDEQLLAQVVREGAGKFFLRNGVPLVTTGVRVVEPGTAWAAGIDQGVARAVEAGCRAAGVRPERFVPAVAVLARGLGGDRIVWTDGKIAAEVVTEDGELVSVRRTSAVGAAATPAPAPLPLLGRLGPDGWRFADAYGAATLPRWERLVAGPSTAAADATPRWRLATAGAAVAVALLFAAIAPTLRAMDREEAARARIAAVQDGRRAAVETARELDRVTLALAEITAFSETGVSPTLLLADLTAALPRGSALVALRVDSAGGTLVGLAPRAAAVLQPLERVPGVVSPEIVGPVTREVAAGRPVERVTLRFGIDGDARRGTATREPAGTP
jgi:hypothetical protein